MTVWSGRAAPVRRRDVIAYVVMLLVYSTILRNLPWEPFTWFYAPDLTPIS